jgi:CBS domain-containing protein
MKVKDVMHKGATFVEAQASVRQVAKRMRETDVGAIPVKADGQLVGIVTDRDIACRALGNGGELSTLTARDIMTKNVVCCSLDDDVQDAIKVMETKQIRRMPVMDNHKMMVGMLSLGDISQRVSKQTAGEVLRAVSGHHA